MADIDKKISQLNSLAAASAEDLIPLVDVDQIETKSIRKDRLMGSPGPVGNNTPDTGEFTTLQVTSGATVDEFSTDVTFAAAANDQLATALAIKTYVDSQTGVGVHNDLLGLQGGDSTAEFYHLTQAIHDGLFSASPTIGIGNPSGTNIRVDYGNNLINMTTDIGGSYITIFDVIGDAGGSPEASIRIGNQAHTYIYLREIDDSGDGSFRMYAGDDIQLHAVNEVTIEIGSTDEVTIDNSGVTLRAGTNINEFSTDGTLSGNSDDAVPTEKAVKTYVDNIQALDTLSGMQGVVSGDSTCTVVFDTPQVDTQYAVVGNLVNEVDTPPSIYPHIITEKTVTGFSVLFSGPVDSGNYVFDWIVSRNSLESSSSSSSKSSSSSSSSAVPLLGINDNEDFLEINDGGDGLLLS